MPFSQAEIEEANRHCETMEERKHAFTRRLIELMGLWRHCDKRACLRGRTCSDPRLCAERYRNAIEEWQRTVLAPYLRKRYPTVSWGAPLAVTEPQLEAALGAERARGSTPDAADSEPAAKPRGRKGGAAPVAPRAMRQGRRAG
jgi:hypothetical protein